MSLAVLHRLFSQKLTPNKAQKIDQEENMLVVNDEDAPAYIAENLENASNELEKLYYSHQGRRILKWHHYLAIYYRHLQPYKEIAINLENNATGIARDGRLRVLEIGVQNGGSLQLWRQYFGAGTVIFGIDIDPRCKEFEEDGCQIRIGDQSDPGFLKRVIDEMGGVDIVIDDGSHVASHQLASFKVLFPILSQDGIYICEDLHASYWDGWEGGYKRAGTFIEFTKDIIDNMHEWYFHNTSTMDDLNLKKSVLGVSVYDSMVVIEKGNKERPYAVHVGNSSF